jgi:hypothetical protein
MTPNAEGGGEREKKTVTRNKWNSTLIERVHMVRRRENIGINREYQNKLVAFKAKIVVVIFFYYGPSFSS